LTALGFGTRGIDGSAGPGTRQALRDWQTSRGIQSTGFLNKPQYDALGATPIEKASSAAASDRPEGRTRRSASRDDDDGDRPARRSSRSSDSDAGSTARALGQAAGGFVRGVTGGKFGF